MQTESVYISEAIKTTEQNFFQFYLDLTWTLLREVEFLTLKGTPVKLLP